MSERKGRTVFRAGCCRNKSGDQMIMELAKKSAISLTDCAGQAFLVWDNQSQLSGVSSPEFTKFWNELEPVMTCNAAIALQITRREREYRQVQSELAHANRVATGQLTASIAHELKQPLSAVVTNGNASLRWLRRQPPVIEKAAQSVEQMIKDVERASSMH